MAHFESRREYFTKASEIIGFVETRREPISLVKGIGAELLGTTLVVLVWLAAAATYGRSDQSSVSLSLTVGFIVATMVWVADYASGGHLNPSITFGMIFTGQVSLLRGVSFIVAQCLGGIFGIGILIGLTADKTDKYGVGFNSTLTIPNMDLHVGQALGVEIIASVVIILVALSVKDENREELHSSGPIAIGLSMAACHFAFMFNTGPGLNPARSFGPAIWSNIWTHHWIYWIGPLLGAIIATLLYLGIFRAMPPRLVEVEEIVQMETQNPAEETSFVEIPITPDAEVENEPPPEEIHELVEIGGTAFVKKETGSPSASKAHTSLNNSPENEKEIIV